MMQDAAEMYARMQRKYGHTNAEVWQEYALFCYRDAKPARLTDARASLDRALTTLPKSTRAHFQYINTIYVLYYLFNGSSMR